MEAWKVSLECQIGPTGFREHQNDPNTAPGRSQERLAQQEASQRGARKLQKEFIRCVPAVFVRFRESDETPREPAELRKEPQNVFNTIFGSKTLVF